MGKWKCEGLDSGPDASATHWESKMRRSRVELSQFHSHITVWNAVTTTLFSAISVRNGTHHSLDSLGIRYQEWIHSTPSWYDHPRYDTAFVVFDDTFPAWKVWLLHMSDYFSRSITGPLTTVAHLSTGLSAKTKNQIQTPGCGWFPWRSRTGRQRRKSLM